MCSHYESETRLAVLSQHFDVEPPVDVGRGDMWPRYPGLFIRAHPNRDVGDDAVPARECLVGRWGLISAKTKKHNDKLSTFNARSETAQRSFTFGNAWERGQKCIIPARAIYEPDWRSGKSVPTRFTRDDEAPLGVAGLWDVWTSAEGEIIHSYTMLTISAEDHPLFRHYHRSGKEKRQVVILPAGAYEEWLTAPVRATRDFLVGFPADRLVAEAHPKDGPSP